MSGIEYFSLTDGPKPVAPYSHAVSVDRWIFVTGQLPIAPDGSMAEGVEEQTKCVLENLRLILETAGASLTGVVMARIYLTNFDAHYERMNAVYKTFFPVDRLPARTCVGVTRLARGCHIEIDVIATRPS